MSRAARRTAEEREEDRADTARYLREMARRQRELAVEFEREARRFDAMAQVEADTGHTWRVTVQCRGSAKVVGDEHHTDAPEWDDQMVPLEVRAWSLSEALVIAAGAPLGVWFPPEEPEEPEDETPGEDDQRV